MYPETVFVDVTSHSNNKKYSLLTFSCKSAVNKHVVFLKAWIPNQKRFSFRWVFKYAIESLGLDKYFQYTELFMKDGDPRQHNEIKRAMTEYLQNDADAACGWHIVHQGLIDTKIDMKALDFAYLTVQRKFSPITGFGDVDSSFLMKAGELSRDPA